MSWLRSLPDPLAREFALVEAGGARALVRRGYEESAHLLGLEGPPATPVGTVGGGRAVHPVVELPGGERAVVRAYRRGGLVRHMSRERYFHGHRAVEELVATERARDGGVRAPVVIAAVERPRRVGYTAALATLWIEDAVELARWLPAASPEEAGAALRETGRQIALMHEAGVTHPDVNLRNVLVAGSGVHLIDFDRARVANGPAASAARSRDLRRLARSARKLWPLGTAGWEELRAGYGAGWPPGLDLP